jgi:hypothetical protein
MAREVGSAGGGRVDNSFNKYFNKLMAKVFAPMFSFKAKGKLADTIQYQPLPYTKAPDARKNAELYQYNVEWVDQSKTPMFGIINPVSSIIGEKCDIWRQVKITMPSPYYHTWTTGCARIEDLEARMKCIERRDEIYAAFNAARHEWDRLSRLEKGSWEIFGLQFWKQDLCTGVVSILAPLEAWMSFAMFAKFSFGLLLKWAPVMSPELSAEAGRLGWKATYWYYHRKLSSLRRAWVLYRKNKYTIKQVMSITEVWKKYKKWFQFKTEIEENANIWWKQLQ